MLEKLLKEYAKDKIVTTLKYTLDRSIDYLISKLICNIDLQEEFKLNGNYDYKVYFSKILKNSEIIFEIKSNTYGSQNFEDIVTKISNNERLEYDCIFKIKNTNVFYRFTNISLKDKFNYGFYIFNNQKEEFLNEVKNILNNVDKKSDKIIIWSSADDTSYHHSIEFFKKKFLKTMFNNYEKELEIIIKHLNNYGSCVVLLYGAPGNQKTTFIGHIISQVYLKLDINYVNFYNYIPKQLYRSVTVIEDLDRHLEDKNYGSEKGTDIKSNLSAFLNLLDGFSFDARKKLVIITANNINNIPDALLNRRFDLQIRFDNPPKTKWLEILNTYLKPDYSNIVVEELNTLEISKLDNPFSASLLLKLAKNLEFLDLEDKELFRYTVLVEYNKLNIV